MPYRPNFPIPADIDPPRKCLCIKIPWTDDHKRVVAGLFWELTDWFNWQRDEAKSGKPLAAVYRDVFNSIDWSDMSCCCNQTIPIIYRIDPENQFNTQISYDGGTTWITNPNQIYNTIIPLAPPPIDAHHTKCDAASNALQHIKDLVAKQEGEMGSDNTIAEVALAIVLFLIGVFLATITEGFALPLIAEFVGVMAAIFSLGLADFTAYWTSDVYDDILCALYCNIETDGTFTSGDFSAVISRLTSHMPDSPAKDWLIQCLNVGGVDGLNNLARYGSSADADCSSCDPCSECPDIASFVETNTIGVTGTIVARTSTHIDVQGDFYAGLGGGYYADISTHDDNICCLYQSREVLSGTMDGAAPGGTFRVGCGDAWATATAIGMPSAGTSVNRLCSGSSVAFTVRYHLSG